LTTLISNILADNQIQIDDGIGKSHWLIQTNGELQGDPLSPTLFIALTHDVGAKIKEETHTVIYMYADDMAPVAYPGICPGGGGSTNTVEDRENGDLGALAP